VALATTLGSRAASRWATVPPVSDGGPIHVEYHLALSDGRVFRHRVELDEETLRCAAPKGEVPEWTALDVCKCPNCPLDAKSSPRCPAAMALVDLVKDVTDVPSTAQVDVTVTLSERTVSAHTTAQRAVGSLAGLLMASSGCPHTSFLGPLARYHLPFSSAQETTFRILSSWALWQVLEARKSRPADFAMSSLLEKLQALQTVNRHVTNRLRTGVEKDAALNAVVLLDALARSLPWEVEDDFVELEKLFAAASRSTPAK